MNPRRPAPTARPSRRASLAPHLVCAGLVLLGVVLRIVHLPVEVHSPDEDTYVTFYATPLYERGPAYVPELVRDYNARREMHDFPPPTRVGHLWLLWAAMEAAGRADVQVASAVSCAAGVAGLLVLWWLAAAVAGPWAAATALTFAVTSPLERAMARRAWGDGPLALASLLAMAALARHFASSGRRRWGVLALAFGALAVLMKESGAVVLGVVTLALAVNAWRTAGWRSAAAWLGAGAAAFAVAGAIVAFASGGIGPLRLALANAESTRHTNAYMLEYLTGGPSLYFRGFAILQPVPIFLGLVAALVLPPWRDPGARPAQRAALLALAGLVVAVLVPALAYTIKNLRFLSPIYPALELLAAALIVRVLGAVRGRMPTPVFRVCLTLVVAGLALSALGENARFVRTFVTGAVPDLATPWLTK